MCDVVLSMVLEVGQLVGSRETPRGFGGVKYSFACPVSKGRSRSKERELEETLYVDCLSDLPVNCLSACLCVEPLCMFCACYLLLICVKHRCWKLTLRGF